MVDSRYKALQSLVFLYSVIEFSVICGHGRPIFKEGKMKESTTANVLRIIFSVLMVFTLGICTTAAMLRLTVLNPDKWEKLFYEEDFKEGFKEDLGYNEENFYMETGFRIKDDDFYDGIYNFVIPEMFEVIKTGEHDIDDDRFDEFWEDTLEEVLEDELDLSSSEMKDAKRTLYNDLQESLDEAAEDLEDEEAFQLIFQFQKSCVATAVVCFILTAAMFVPLLLIHKNKFVPLRALGLVTLISQALNAVGFTGFWALIGMAIEEDASSEIEECLAKFWNSGTLPIFLAFAGLAAAGLALMIFSIAMKKNADQVNDAESDM